MQHWSVNDGEAGGRAVPIFLRAASPGAEPAKRDASGAPIAIVESTLVSIGAGELLDVSWVDGTTIALLLRSGQSTTVSTATLGGRLESLGALENGEQIVGGNGVEGIRVLDSDGVVHRPSGDSSWLDTGLRASFLATQQ